MQPGLAALFIVADEFTIGSGNERKYNYLSIYFQQIGRSLFR